jgi:hypothetical protein
VSIGLIRGDSHWLVYLWNRLPTTHQYKKNLVEKFVAPFYRNGTGILEETLQFDLASILQNPSKVQYRPRYCKFGFVTNDV